MNPFLPYEYSISQYWSMCSCSWMIPWESNGWICYSSNLWLMGRNGSHCNENTLSFSLSLSIQNSFHLSFPPFNTSADMDNYRHTWRNDKRMVRFIVIPLTDPWLPYPSRLPYPFWLQYPISLLYLLLITVSSHDYSILLFLSWPTLLPSHSFSRSNAPFYRGWHIA